jgi:hypothetical protein
MALGNGAATYGQNNKIAISGSNIGASGECQIGLLNLSALTTDATVKTLTTSKNAVSSNTIFALRTKSVFGFKGILVAVNKADHSSASWEINGLAKRGAAAANTVLVGSTVTKVYGDASLNPCTVELAADTTNGGIIFNVTGIAATNIEWVLSLYSSELAYA